MKIDNHDRYLRDKRRKSIKRRIFFATIVLAILILMIKFKTHKEEYIANKKMLQEMEKNYSRETTDKKPENNEQNLEKPSDDEEIFRQILKNENVFVNTYKRNELLHNLEIFAKYNKNAKLIMKHADDIHISLLKLAGNNYTAVNFVAKTIDPSIKNDYSYHTKANQSDVPLFLQWDRRWGYEKYGYGIIGYTGCGPTSCAMVLSTMKKDNSITPALIAEESDRNGFSSSDGTSWDFYPFIASKYGLKAVQVNPDYNTIKYNIKKKNFILISVRPGDFTRVGHVMVISAIDKDGNIIINDPNSLINSQKKWSYKRLQPQIKKMWIFSNGV